ncbi:MAG: sirohydrochlorin cobaltochelatase [Syntrophobacterales bacterium]|nr:sirohydrochlorin cobaltochelatase [Syntrophobacterales bacterium]
MHWGDMAPWLLVVPLLLGLGIGAEAAAKKPAIVLTTFGTSTAAFDTYKHIENLAKERFPGYEIRWAYTSGKVRRKVLQEQGKDLPDLPQVLKDLKAAGFTRVAVQSLMVVPGEEWDLTVKQSRTVPGLQVACGQPLLASQTDRIWVLKALARTFPRDLQQNAVVLVGHGSPSARGQAAFADWARLVRSRYPGQNVFFGVVTGQPSQAAVLAAVRQSGATAVTFIPFLLVAGEHAEKDILGDQPESWKSQLLQTGKYRVEGVRKGLGYQDGVVRLYLDHLDEALKILQ